MRHCWHASASPARPGMLEGEQKPQSPRSTPSNLLQTPAASAATKTRAQQRQPEAAELRRRAFGPRHVAYLAYLPAGSLLPGHNGKQARPVKSMHPFTALRSALPTGQAFHNLRPRAMHRCKVLARIALCCSSFAPRSSRLHVGAKSLAGLAVQDEGPSNSSTSTFFAGQARRNPSTELFGLGEGGMHQSRKERGEGRWLQTQTATARLQFSQLEQIRV